MVDASVTGGSNIGILVNTNNGTVENSYVTGFEGSSTVGGLAGYSNGIVRNSYSTADVTAQLNQAGGLIGITNSGSLTENVYASGAVQGLRSNGWVGTYIWRWDNMAKRPVLQSVSEGNEEEPVRYGESQPRHGF